MLLGQLTDIILGTIFLFFGLTSCVIAAIRQRNDVRVLVWLGIWSGMYGTRLLTNAPAVITVLPRALQIGVPYVDNAITYLLEVSAFLAWSELTVGKLRRFTRMMAVLGFVVGLVGIGWFWVTGSNDKLLTYNNLVAISVLMVLATVVAVPKLSGRFLLFSNPILAISTLVFTIEALYVNLTRILPFPNPFFLNNLLFASFLFSFAYVAGQKVFANERRLLSIDRELEIAREIQKSILPAGVPEVKNLRIAASYQPMTAVGGDFYEFIRMDDHRIGFLVADVSGHGIPAALIASMIKVAVQSVVSCADDPAEVLRRLNRILSGQLRGRLVSAAYFWIDMEIAEGRYSAAGHPPLLHQREGALSRVECNGLLFGVLADCDYTVCNVPLERGDRFLLYTDGIVEAENPSGDTFGDWKLEEVVHNNQSCTPIDFSTQLLSEIGHWKSDSVSQQDDITLIVIDIV